MASTTVSLKLLIDTKGSRVLFAEASKEFVDFLFNILSLPIGTVIRLLTKQGMVGCLGNLYDSIENLSETFILPTQSKHNILNPKVFSSAASMPLLLPNLKASGSGKLFYKCNDQSYSNCHLYVASDPTASCPTCKSLMVQKMTFVEPSKSQDSSFDKGGYVRGVVTYMIMDDLVVSPMSAISSITLLNKFHVGTLEEKMVELSIDEGVKLLKAALQSKTVLSDVFLGKKKRKVI